MFEKLRAELRAITEWSCQTQILRTQTEKEAISFARCDAAKLLDG